MLFRFRDVGVYGVKHVEAFGDLLLVVQQIFENFQCLDRSLNAFLDKWLDITRRMDEFKIYHMLRLENSEANELV